MNACSSVYLAQYLDCFVRRLLPDSECIEHECTVCSSAVCTTCGTQALQGRLAVPHWAAFTDNVSRIYEPVKATEHGGKNADYLSVLSAQVRISAIRSTPFDHLA